jgi:hypothetical protein
MSAATYNLFIDQGSDFAIDLVIKENGSGMDLSNYQGRGQLRSSHTSSTIAGYFKVTKTDQVNGIIKVEIPNGSWLDTSVSPPVQRDGSTDIPAGQYVYDLEIHTTADAVVKRLMQGTATINPEVTR